MRSCTVRGAQVRGCVRLEVMGVDSVSLFRKSMLVSSISKSLEPPEVEGIWKEDSEKSWSREASEMSGKWRMLISEAIFERNVKKTQS